MSVNALFNDAAAKTTIFSLPDGLLGLHPQATTSASATSKLPSLIQRCTAKW
jgi:hypothetical protein